MSSARGLCSTCCQFWKKRGNDPERLAVLDVLVSDWLKDAEAKRDARSAASRNRALEREQARPNSEKRTKALKARYGITQEDYEQMLLDQKGVCAVVGCGRASGGIGNWLYVDHCHTTGRIRGLLCPGCNTAVSAIDRGVEYVKALACYVGVPL